MKKFYLLLITTTISLLTFAQNAKDTADGKFHDELLNNFVGKWTASGIVHGMQFNNLDIDAAWIMNHQYLQIHEKGIDTVPFINMPWEALFIIGYNSNDKHYDSS